MVALDVVVVVMVVVVVVNVVVDVVVLKVVLVENDGTPTKFTAKATASPITKRISTVNGFNHFLFK